MIFMIGYRSSQWWNQPHNDKKNHLCHVFVNFVAFRSPSFNLFFFPSPPPQPPTRMIIIKVSVWLFEPENGSQRPKRPRVSNLFTQPCALN